MGEENPTGVKNRPGTRPRTGEAEAGRHKVEGTENLWVGKNYKVNIVQIKLGKV